MTIVVECYAGPGAGKSTTSAQLFCELKAHGGPSVELVQEYIKIWAWEGRKIQPADQIYITAKQMRAEVRLYNKVDVIITDAPILMGAFYEQYYGDQKRSKILLDIYSDVVDNAQRVRYQIPRVKAYDQRGRYETEEKAKEIDKAMREFVLFQNPLPYFHDVKTAAQEIIDLWSKKNDRP